MRLTTRRVTGTKLKSCPSMSALTRAVLHSVKVFQVVHELYRRYDRPGFQSMDDGSAGGAVLCFANFPHSVNLVAV